MTESMPDDELYIRSRLLQLTVQAAEEKQHIRSEAIEECTEFFRHYKGKFRPTICVTPDGTIMVRMEFGKPKQVSE